MRSVSDLSIAAASSRLREEGSDLAGRCCLRPGKCAKEIEADRTISAKASSSVAMQNAIFSRSYSDRQHETMELIEHNG
jgi:hypothetical protein